MTFPENINFNKFLKGIDQLRPIDNLQLKFFQLKNGTKK